MKKEKNKPSTKEMWICGQLRGEWKAEGSVWDFQGVFSNEEKAEKACRNEKYFIFLATLNEELPDQPGYPVVSRYPLLDKKLK